MWFASPWNLLEWKRCSVLMCSFVNGIFSQIFSNAMVIVINNQGIVKKASRGRSRSPAITTIFAIYRGRSFKCLYDRKAFFRSRLNISLEIQWLIQVPLTKVGELCSIQPATLFNSLQSIVAFLYSLKT